MSNVIAERPAANLPQSTTEIIFTATGLVRVVSVVGIVTTAIQNQAMAASLSSSAPLGQFWSENVAGATVGRVLNAFNVTYQPFVLSDGKSITFTCDASNTGQVRWVAEYIPLEPDSLIEAV